MLVLKRKPQQSVDIIDQETGETIMKVTRLSGGRIGFESSERYNPVRSELIPPTRLHQRRR